jgi:hypothetical protein
LRQQSDVPVIKASTPSFAVAKAAAGSALSGGHELGATTPAVSLVGTRRAVEGRLTAVVAVAIAEAASPAPEAAPIIVAAIPIVVIPKACDLMVQDP